MSTPGPSTSRATRIALALVVLAASLQAPKASAGGDSGFTVIHYEPTPGRDRIFSVPGTLVGPHLSVYGGFWFSYADGLR